MDKKDNSKDIFLGYEKTSYNPIQQYKLEEYKVENKQTKKEDINWIDLEIDEIQSNQMPQGERLPTLKLEPKKLTDVEIEIKEPFKKWNTTNSKGQQITKALIKVKHNNELKIWWLNTKNPVYREIIQGIKIGKTKFRVLQTGIQADTRYELIE